MDEQIKQNWVKALRSGEYNQAKGALYKPYIDGDGNDGYCCLGVLAQVDPNIEFQYDEEAEAWYVQSLEYQEFLPNDFMDLVGLNPDFSDDLAHHNDKGFTFDEIADLIEQEA